MTPETAIPTSRLVSRWQRLLASEWFILLLCAGYFLAGTLLVPGFCSLENLGNILANLLPLLVVATGQTMVLILGGIDLSATSIMALASVLGALAMKAVPGGELMATVAGVVTMLGVGAVIGLANGLTISRLRLPPFMATLTAMMFISGFAIWLTQSRKINELPPWFNSLGGNTWLALLISLSAVASLNGFIRRSVFGRWLYAAGQNARTAGVSGVPVDQVTVIAYVLSGVFAALGGILLTARGETGDPVLGRYLLLDVIGAAAIGGTSFYGGKGRIGWTAAGALFIKLVDNSLGLYGCSHFTIMMVKGALILAAALADVGRKRLATLT